MTICELYDADSLSQMDEDDLSILKRELLRHATVNGNGRIVKHDQVYAKYLAVVAECQKRTRFFCV